METDNFHDLAAAWIAYHSVDEESNEAAEHFWAVDAIMVDSFGKPEKVWRFILEVLKKDSSQKVMGALSAGPLENLLQDHGHQFIDLIEKEAATNSKLKHLLGGVWKSDIDEEIWNRVQKAR